MYVHALEVIYTHVSVCRTGRSRFYNPETQGQADGDSGRWEVLCICQVDPENLGSRLR